jgi:hypothetical protein
VKQKERRIRKLVPTDGQPFTIIDAVVQKAKLCRGTALAKDSEARRWWPHSSSRFTSRNPFFVSAN